MTYDIPERPIFTGDPNDHPGVCEPKTRYASEEYARRDIAKWPTQAPFACSVCGGWHAGKGRTPEQRAARVDAIERWAHDLDVATEEMRRRAQRANTYLDQLDAARRKLERAKRCIDDLEGPPSPPVRHEDLLALHERYGETLEDGVVVEIDPAWDFDFVHRHAWESSKHMEALKRWATAEERTLTLRIQRCAHPSRWVACTEIPGVGRAVGSARKRKRAYQRAAARMLDVIAGYGQQHLLLGTMEGS